MVYKRTKAGWEIFGRHKVTTRRFKKLRMSVQSIPPKCTPIQAIASIEYLIVVTDYWSEIMRDEGKSIYSIWQKTVEDGVICHYYIDQDLIQRLKQACHSMDCKLVCATDGGLKDTVGTSSYAIFCHRKNRQCYQAEPANINHGHIHPVQGRSFWAN